MARSSSAQMPVPAEPAPSTAMRWSRKRHAGHIDRAQQRADRDRGGALNVVVEGAQLVAIARQQPVGVADGEILPMQQDMRPALAHRGDKRLDQLIIFGAAHALVLPADIERIGEVFLVVGADIENDRQRGRRMQPGAGGIKRELADRNAHAAGALVAEAEDALAVADDDGLDTVEARMTEDAADGVLMRKAEEQAARLAENAG